MASLYFEDKIKIINGNPYVTPPKDILESIFRKAKKDKGPIPVKGKINGSPYKQTLVKYMGDWRLYINGIMLKAAGIKFRDGEIRFVVGSKVAIEIAFDAQSRKLPMHPKLQQALAKDEKARTEFQALAPYRKHEILRYLGFLKNDNSIHRNVQRILEHLRGEESDALYPLMHRKKVKS